MATIHTMMQRVITIILDIDSVWSDIELSLNFQKIRLLFAVYNFNVTHELV